LSVFNRYRNNFTESYTDIKYTEHVACAWEMGSVHHTLVYEPEWKRLHERSRSNGFKRGHCGLIRATQNLVIIVITFCVT
jgi:hypothetical protein